MERVNRYKNSYKNLQDYKYLEEEMNEGDDLLYKNELNQLKETIKLLEGKKPIVLLISQTQILRD